MKNLISLLLSPLPAVRAGWMLVTALLTLVSVDHVIRERKLPPHPYVKATMPLQEELRQHTEPVQGRLFIYFVDSLRFDYAVNPELMPHLNALLPQSVWGRVTPCATNMTVHCVEAAFSGIDRSTVLAFGEDFNPQKSKNKTSWFFQMKNRGARITAVSDYVIPTLYSGALTENYVYPKGTSQRFLVNKALSQFSRPDTNVTIVHLLGPHDDGQTFGSNSPQYRSQLKEVDELLGHVVSRLSPTDSLMVMGDHGMDDDGRHMYNMDVPTFYLYRGPDFARGVRRDIHLLSHTFFLTVLFRLPFYPEYQGDFHWDAFQESVQQLYGDPAVRSLSRPVMPARIHVSRGYFVRFCMLALLWILGLGLLLQSPVSPVSLRLGIPWAVASTVLLFLGWFWALFLLQAVMGVHLLRQSPARPKLPVFLVLGIFLAGWGVFRGFTYHAFDMAVHEVRIFFTYAFYLLELGAGIFLYTLLFRPADWRRRLWGGSIAALMLAPLLHYPSLYAYGYLRSLPFFASVHFFASALLFLDSRLPFDGRRERADAVLMSLAAGLLLLPQYSMFVENFRIFDFPRLPHREGSFLNAAIVFFPYALAVAAAARLLRIERRTLGFLLPAALLPFAAWVWGGRLSFFLYGIVFLALIVYWNIKIKIFSPGLQWFIAFLGVEFSLSYAYSFSFQVFYQIQMLLICGFALLEEARLLEKHAPDLPRAGLFVPGAALVLLSFIAFFGIRTCGIDFRFALAWFPNMFETLWFLVFGATVVKYFAPAFLLAGFEAARGRKWSLAVLMRWSAFLVWAILPMLVTLLLLRESVPLVVDTLEESMYLAGVLLLALTLTALPTRAFWPRPKVPDNGGSAC